MLLITTILTIMMLMLLLVHVEDNHGEVTTLAMRMTMLLPAAAVFLLLVRSHYKSAFRGSPKMDAQLEQTLTKTTVF